MGGGSCSKVARLGRERNADLRHGYVLDREHAVISVFDHGFLYGEGIYETLRTYRGRPFLYDRHMRRLRRSAAMIQLAVPLTEARSIAVDPRAIPLGAPVFLSTTMPNSSAALNRLMLAQDTGGAIRGPVRADFFWGFGADAGAQAGKMRQQGRMWVLLPHGHPVSKSMQASPGG